MIKEGRRTIPVIREGRRIMPVIKKGRKDNYTNN